MASAYRRTQFGWVIVLCLGAGAVFAVVYGILTAWPPIMTFVLVLLGIALLLFHSLTIVVTPDEFRCFFGVGWIGRRIPMSDIVAARAVRNFWLYGWGIRLTPSGWMFNVSGLRAVELELRSGKRFRVGTDRPEEVVEAIDRCRENPAAPDPSKR